ncbi:phytoene/squalene synthetase [Agromyces terreus]|uniref:Phytoene/squalene synthetase n=1 Tax=Agromyces terreus TaxID=424795 RepID=A0A9X2H2W9_9MICO|nr:squalene/phytoene synthase family protein [Agromyces terreus]MCP2371675.1 phytoene/squalene synthetase [Agromyces terreus]
MKPRPGLLERYDATAVASAATVIGRYSTSFGAAARMLDPTTRRGIRSIYALVRVADELVDGTADAAGLTPPEQACLLDELETETESAMLCGYSTNLVVHAFARTARDSGIDLTLTRPFFASMRRDLDPTPIREAEVAPYIHGSAEVVGLMCLAVFLLGDDVDPARRARLERGAVHLGAAFQKINFLRDLETDWRTLGRNYFPWCDPEHFGEDDKHRILDDIDHDLDLADAAIPELPRRARAAVLTAHGLFSALTRRCRQTPAEVLMSTRIRVPDAAKLAIALRSMTKSIGRTR